MLNELITIFFFSGTGGVRKIAKKLEKQFKERAFRTYLYEIDYTYFKLDANEIDENVKKSYFPIMVKSQGKERCSQIWKNINDW